MSDYLDHLTAKGLNLMEGIQPRLASLFEPPSAAGRPIAARRSVNVETEPDEPFFAAPSFEVSHSTQESSSHAGQSRPSTRGLRRPAAIQPQQPTVIADNSMHQLPGQWVNRQPASLLTSEAADTASGQLRTQPGLNPTRTISPSTPAVSSSPASAGPLDAKAAQPSHPDMPISVPATAGQGTTAVPSTHTGEREIPSALEHIIDRAVHERCVLFEVPQSKNITDPQSVSAHTKRPSTPAMTVVQPYVTTYREPPASIPSEVTAMPAPAPIIRITIGRVDVRAIMPAAPAPRPAPARPRPALSLEDYLKQREEGRR